MPGFQTRKKRLKKEGRNFSSFTFLVPLTFVFFALKSVPKPDFQWISQALISVGGSSVFQANCSVWYSFQSSLFLKYGFLEKWKVNLKPLRKFALISVGGSS